MHSRIFQISTKPIEKDDYYDEWRYDDTNLSFCDYIIKSDNRIEDINWLCGTNKGVLEKTKNGFKVINKKLYFENKHKSFKSIADSLAKTNLEQFIGSIDMLMFHLNELYNDEFGFHIDGDEFGISTFDEFMRIIAEEGIEYYIGATFDYHW